MPEIVVDSLDSVDEAIRGAYVEQDGKFSLDPDKYADLKVQTQVTGLKNKNSELIKKLNLNKEAAKRFEKFQELEDDELEELLELRESKNNPPPQDGKPNKGTEELQLQANFEKALKKATDKHTAEKTELENRVKDLDEKLKLYELTVPIRDA